MINPKILEGIEKRFAQKDCTGKLFRVIIWQNTQDGFSFDLDEYRAELKKKDIELINLPDSGPLALKSRLLDERDQRFVVYIPNEAEFEHRDAILDLRLSLPVFMADQWSLFLDEIGLGGRVDLTDTVKRFARYFSESKFRKKLAEYRMDPKSETEETLLLRMMSVIVHADDPGLSSILFELFTKSDHSFDASSAFEKYGLQEIFWKRIEQQFGYSEENPTISKFALQLFASDLSVKTNIDGTSLALYRKGDSGASFRFCQQWRNSVSSRASYIVWSSWAADIFKDSLGKLFTTVDMEQLLSIQTFNVEEYILSRLVSKLLQSVQNGGAGLRKKILDISLSRKRLDFWLAESSSERYRSSYTACYHAARFLDELAVFHPEGIGDVSGYIQAYTGEWFRIDQDLRLYTEAVMDVAGVELFKDLSARLETAYREQYLARISSVWMSLISPDGKSVSAWNCASVLKQHDFYKTQIVPYLEAGPNRRAYVIVSDALRFEVGEELSAMLSGNARYTVSLSSALTGLPSITRLGMAALLPHGSLTISAADSVLVDGKNAQGLENRKKILNAYNGIAIDADSLLAMKRDEARAFQKSASVIYIYHDAIDATGDKAASEDMTFKACRSACVDLEQVIRYITNTMNGSHIVVTADHGFLYTSDDVPESQRSALSVEVPVACESKKRYKLGKALAGCTGAVCGSCKDFGFEDTGFDFLIPYGIQLFHFVGGAKFFHGGVMPQEVIIPVVTVKPDQDASRKDGQKMPVEAGVIGLPSMITTRVFTVRVFQAEAIGETNIARTVKAGVYYGAELLSDTPEVLLNSDSDDSKSLTKQIKLHLTGEHFDPKTDYLFVLRDADSGALIYEQTIRISLMILDEF